MNKRYLFQWSIIFIFLLSLLACSPQQAAATPEIVIVSTAGEPTSEPVLPTPLPTNTVEVPSVPVITRMNSGETIQITSIHMVTITNGWAVGGIAQASDHVFHTNDGGLTWDDVTPPEPASTGEDGKSALAFFKNATTAWVIYAPTSPGVSLSALNIWSTHDVGQTWQIGSVDTSISDEMFMPQFLTFADDTHGWLMVVLGGGMMHVYVAVFATSDGGTTWTDIIDPYNDGGGFQSFSKTDFYFVDAQNGWLSRDSHGVDAIPHVFRTTDGGVNWTRIDLPAPTDLPQLYSENSCGTYTVNVFSPNSVTLAMKCLDNATYDKQLNFQVATLDGGANWQTIALPEGYLMDDNYSGLLYFDENYGFALGRNIYQTTDGGKTWTLIKQVNWDGQFSFVNMNMGWAVARSEGELALVRTTTGGANWEIINPYIAP